jgi:hypothetical protein
MTLGQQDGKSEADRVRLAFDDLLDVCGDAVPGRRNIARRAERRDTVRVPLVHAASQSTYHSGRARRQPCAYRVLPSARI